MTPTQANYILQQTVLCNKICAINWYFYDIFYSKLWVKICSSFTAQQVAKANEFESMQRIVFGWSVNRIKYVQDKYARRVYDVNYKCTNWHMKILHWHLFVWCEFQIYVNTCPQQTCWSNAPLDKYILAKLNPCILYDKCPATRHVAMSTATKYNIDAINYYYLFMMELL